MKTWDAVIKASRNGTFLFERRYMDYHRDRFEDCSILFTEDDGKLLGALPACTNRSQTRIDSHGGLTYGGFVICHNTQAVVVREMMKSAASTYLDMGFKSMSYKPVPYIYQCYPADEPLYWLTRAGATLSARALSSAIALHGDIRQKLWHRKMKKNACQELFLSEGAEHLRDFWSIVEEVLSTRHGARPVHSADEISLLMSRCPENIRLVTVLNADKKVITGALLFVTDTTVHVQYMEAGEEARRRRALDWLIRQLIEEYAASDKRYFDFGISTEKEGQYLNEGLAYQKEGFGGRAVCYDTYAVDLERLYKL